MPDPDPTAPPQRDETDLAVGAPAGTPPRSLEQSFERLLTSSRVLVVVPVVVLLLAALGAFVYGADVFAQGARTVARQPVPVGNKIGLFLTVVDLFLVGATLLIAAIGLYELFISRVDAGGARKLPRWLEMQDLNDLKVRVVAMIVLVSSVSFVQAVVDAESGRQVLELGGGIALVVAALTLFVRFGSPGGGHGAS
ncbi:MAG: YqhA family protein [Actinomycetota bacterium]|nr:YqhA family protein [Actinomycetota bacterium]